MLRIKDFSTIFRSETVFIETEKSLSGKWRLIEMLSIKNENVLPVLYLAECGSLLWEADKLSETVPDGSTWGHQRRAAVFL